MKMKLIFSLLLSIIIISCLELNGQYLSSKYQDENISCLLTIQIKSYSQNDTIKAQLYFKNIGHNTIYTERQKNIKACIELLQDSYFSSNCTFRYNLLGAIDYLHDLTHYEMDIYLLEVKPEEDILYSFVIPLKNATQLKGCEKKYDALHAKNESEHFGIQLNVGYLPKDVKSLMPILNTDGKLDYSTRESIIWIDSKIKQFTLGPLYVGIK